jgi:hypothetical protein
MLRIIVVAAMFLALIAPLGHAETVPQRRVALVIGNGTNEHLPRLANPVTDAELMADALKFVGFELVGGKAQTDLYRAGFERVAAVGNPAGRPDADQRGPHRPRLPADLEGSRLGTTLTTHQMATRSP